MLRDIENEFTHECMQSACVDFSPSVVGELVPLRR